MTLDLRTVADHVDAAWAGDVVDRLHEFIAIPDVSPAFDADWVANGHIAAAVALVRDWCAGRPIDGMTVEVQELDGRSPVVVCEIPATGPGSDDPGTDDTVVLYGHLDKQPEMTGWRDGLGPWSPVLDGDRLYGRGGADDGYSVFAALTAVEALRAGDARPDHHDPVDLVRARTWEPAIANIAVDGFPRPDRASNVLRPYTELTIAARLAPEADPAAASRALVERLTADPPAGAEVTFSVDAAERGWNAPPTEPWLQAAVDEASASVFGRPSSAMGEGGTIPFMAMLGARFPDAQFLITGVLGPGSNAHGPNEFLHLPMARGIAASVSHVLDAHRRR